MFAIKRILTSTTAKSPLGNIKNIYILIDNTSRCANFLTALEGQVTRSEIIRTKCLTNLTGNQSKEAVFFTNTQISCGGAVTIAKVHLEISPISSEKELTKDDLARAINITDKVIRNFIRKSFYISFSYSDDTTYKSGLIKDPLLEIGLNGHIEKISFYKLA
jgi:hypothetical protein